MWRLFFKIFHLNLLLLLFIISQKVFSLPQVQLLRIDQFGAMLVSENNDYARQRAGELKPAMIINSPYYYGGVPQGTNVSVLEVTLTSFVITF